MGNVSRAKPSFIIVESVIPIRKKDKVMMAENNIFLLIVNSILLFVFAT